LQELPHISEKGLRDKVRVKGQKEQRQRSGMKKSGRKKNKKNVM